MSALLLHYYQWRTQDFRKEGVEAPQSPRGVGYGERVSPSPQGRGAPSPEIFLTSERKMASFGAFWVLCPLSRNFFIVGLN